MDTSVLLSGGETSSGALSLVTWWLRVKVAVDQLERHQRRAPRGTRGLNNMTCEEGWEKLESREQCRGNETPLYLSRCLGSFHGRAGASRVLNRHFLNWSFVGKQFWAWVPCYLYRSSNLPRWCRGRSIQTLVHPHVVILDATRERNYWGNWLFDFPSNWVLLQKKVSV